MSELSRFRRKMWWTMLAKNESGTMIEYVPFIVSVKSLMGRVCFDRTLVSVSLKSRDALCSCLLRQTSAVCRTANV